MTGLLLPRLALHEERVANLIMLLEIIDNAWLA